MMRPKQRHKLRIFLGRHFYTLKRYLEWFSGKTEFANKRGIDELPHQIYKHQSLLLRKLKDVDMWIQHNKIKNLKLAIERLNGIVIQPGETFSYWKLLGKPSKKKGYVEGMVLYYGTYRTGIGGGLCQLSNLIYWATLHTPLNVVERHRHSYDVFPDSNRKLPFGSGATCAYNYLDLRIKNNTNQPYRLKLYLDDENLVGEWQTTNPPINKYEVYEKDHRISLEYWGGYVRHNTIHRRIFNLQNELVDDEYVTENHALMMYQPFLEDGSNKES